ncbi:hypothetical protein HCN44_001801 [Aphidius gifuensis]|uniref:Uncharacterized protein n=1 Tax=Aphidius gifuensis TaxID=684658 RepID=A0A835CSP3_APHGI|nr:hypothetical protein HCN44_001801 [Aphidius gifuensis]
MEVNNLARGLNNFSLDEQSKYDNVFRKNIETFIQNIPLFNNCLKNYNSLKKSLRCIDQHRNSQNKTEHEHYGSIKNLLDAYNSVLIPKIKDIEKKFITAANKILSDAKNNNNELIKRKSSIIILPTIPTNKISCETNTLEDKYETGREILLSISIHHENITSIFAKINKEYDDLSNIFSNINNKNINDFIELSKKRIVMEVNKLAQILNKISLDEQSKYEDFIKTNINTFHERMPLFDNCIKRYNSLKKSLRCIDQHQNSKNKTEHDFYENIKNLLDKYNSVLIPKVEDVKRNFITSLNVIKSIAKNDNEELIKRKSSLNIPSIAPTNKICCETNNLEDKFETGREIILSISIHHENITSIFAKIDKEYDDLSNIFNDLNNKSINDFIDLSKKQIVMEVNNLAKTLNKFSIDEQSKYEDFVRTNTNTFKEKMPLFNNCLKNYNSLKKSLRCIDQHQITKNATDNELYKNLKNLLDLYNTILIPKIKDIEKRFITATNEIIFIAKNTNDELINKKSNISLPSTSATNKV